MHLSFPNKRNLYLNGKKKNSYSILKHIFKQISPLGKYGNDFKVIYNAVLKCLLLFADVSIIKRNVSVTLQKIVYQRSRPSVKNH